jgi:hypothetical protein
VQKKISSKCYLDVSLFLRLQFGMAFFRPDARQIYCVLCKRCHRNVPAGVNEQPKKYIAVTCLLCRESRLYLPTEVGLDYAHHEVAQRTR